MAKTHKHKKKVLIRLGLIEETSKEVEFRKKKLTQKVSQKKVMRKKIVLPHEDFDHNPQSPNTSDWPGSRMPNPDHRPYQRQG